MLRIWTGGGAVVDFNRGDAGTSADERLQEVSKNESASYRFSEHASQESSTKVRVLIVEDNADDIDLALLTLRRDGFDVSGDVAQTAEEFTARIRTAIYDVIIADYNLPQWKGMETLDILRRENLEVPLIVVTGYLGEEKAVECIRKGATDCILKDHLARLPSSVRRALEEKQLRELRRRSETELAKKVAELAGKVAELASKVAELASSNEELEQFAYVASHDLQEPLRMIANYTQLLADRYKGKLDKQADKFIGYAVDGAIRLQALIQDLLRLSQLGKGELDLKITESSEVVEKAVQSLRTAIEETGAVVTCRDLPAVMTDRSQLTQVFHNLIANAVKFHGAEKPRIEINAQRRGHEWVLTVSDNGIGIPIENWNNVFIIFRRQHSRTEYPGNGIGLAICKKIIERHGGRIWIDAQPRPGCCFRFSLPAGPVAHTQKPAG
jgi:signal transduction histidine kinase